MALILSLFYGIVLVLNQINGQEHIPMDLVRQGTAVVLILIYSLLFFSKLRDAVKAILLAGLLAFSAFTGYLMFNQTPLVGYGVAAFIILLVIFVLFQYKKPWYYYYVIVMSLMGMLIMR